MLWARKKTLTVLLQAPDCAHALHDRVVAVVQGGHLRLTKDARGIDTDLMPLYTWSGRAERELILGRAGECLTLTLSFK